MSGFILDNAVKERVLAELPDIEKFELDIKRLMPDLISTQYHPNSEIPIAAVCCKLHKMNKIRQPRYFYGNHRETREN